MLVEVVPLISLDAGAVLAHQDKKRQKDRLKGNDGRQVRERKGIEGHGSLGLHVQHEPNRKQHYMENDEPHSPGLHCDDIPDPC